MVAFGAKLQAEYVQLWRTATIPNRVAVNAQVTRILANQKRYQAVQAQTKVPWYLIACIHSLESSLDFTEHLHNGDPLSARTVHVPKGRPAMGNPPFTWEQSAFDAISHSVLYRCADWSTAHFLYLLEEYNGMGYRQKATGCLSPYLWSYTNHYTKGKFIRDGVFSANQISKQIGCVALIKTMGVIKE